MRRSVVTHFSHVYVDFYTRYKYHIFIKNMLKETFKFTKKPYCQFSEKIII